MKNIIQIAFFISMLVFAIVSLSSTEEKVALEESQYEFNTSEEAEASKAAFLKAYEVFMHPRCVNCHPAGDAPLQGDDSRIHAQNVKRGPDGKGLFALKCSNCHQSENLLGDNMPPGHPSWHLPPADKKMIFQGKSPRALAEHLQNDEFTGFENWKEDLIQHIEKDPLVKHSWTYGTAPPLSHEDFVASVKEWIEKGAVLPDE